MPSNLVVNRASQSALKRTNFYVDPDTTHAVAARARQLHVSVGSLADTALRMLVALPPEEVAALLRLYGHLTDDQHEIVRGFAATLSPAHADGDDDLLDGYTPPTSEQADLGPAPAMEPSQDADEAWAGPITPDEALEALAML